MEAFTATRLADHLQHRTHRDRYIARMESGLQEKLAHLVPYLENLPTRHAKILSVGAGSGKLEQAVAELFPRATVIALDASLPMLQTIQKNQAEKNGSVSLDDVYFSQVLPLLADGVELPFAPESLDVIICSSVIHELLSFKFNYQLSDATHAYFTELGALLKPGGKLIINDFMQSTFPESMVMLTLNQPHSAHDAEPLAFLEKFATDFSGSDLTYLTKQINALKRVDCWRPGATLYLQASDITEVAAHYSWASSPEEIEERYTYLPLAEYATMVKTALSTPTHSAEIEAAYTYPQPGYAEHINGRLDFFHLNGTPLSLPDFKGTIVIKKG